MTDNPLARVEAAHRMLAEARTVDEIKDVRDKAKAAALYAKERGYSLEIQNYAAEIRLRAERKAGELLAEVQRTEGGGRPRKLAAAAAASFPTPYQDVVATAGLNDRTARRWQELARIPEPEFEARIAQTRAEGEEITTARIIERVVDAAGDDDGSVARARLKAAMSAGVRDARDLFRLRPEAVADILTEGDYASICSLELEAAAWFEEVHAARNQGLHVIGA